MCNTQGVLFWANLKTTYKFLQPQILSKVILFKINKFESCTGNNKSKNKLEDTRLTDTKELIKIGVYNFCANCSQNIDNASVNLFGYSYSI